jgi:hypothetical protein
VELREKFERQLIDEKVVEKSINYSKGKELFLIWTVRSYEQNRCFGPIHFLLIFTLLRKYFSYTSILSYRNNCFNFKNNYIIKNR